MKPLLALVATGALLASGPSLAQSTKHIMRLSELLLLPPVSTVTKNQTTTGEWKDLLHTTLTTQQPKNLVMVVALEAGLHTDAPAPTPTRGRPITGETSSARGTLELRLLVDGVQVAPGPLILTESSQNQMTRFGDMLDSCSDTDGDGTVLASECIFTGEEQQRVLGAIDLHALSFALDDIDTGTHDLRVQARITVTSQGASGSASAGAWLGRGSITLEEVRLVKSFDISG
ncbi:hypothetical protein [Vitiosangium sp. GDMCC 1.1324]|uniref:hypothetical protein n=1 Tax=Vitiosangium sp. (strain GDMCC 1.1324) TaxID=2138576 RepID=UPI000D3A8B40|nr:hypothetical protein [Vitiosangium sp. GDMCC 1.1324]PTL79297.1 hypothetical protein DAT35_34405 [Vitiosangium sp. GDMCC 1.1324]